MLVVLRGLFWQMHEDVSAGHERQKHMRKSDLMEVVL